MTSETHELKVQKDGITFEGFDINTKSSILDFFSIHSWRVLYKKY